MLGRGQLCLYRCDWSLALHCCVCRLHQRADKIHFWSKIGFPRIIPSLLQNDHRLHSTRKHHYAHNHHWSHRYWLLQQIRSKSVDKKNLSGEMKSFRIKLSQFPDGFHSCSLAGTFLVWKHPSLVLYSDSRVAWSMSFERLLQRVKMYSEYSQNVVRM